MKTRSRVQKLFLHWLMIDRDRFIYPIRVNRISKDTITFNFYGITPAIRGEFFAGNHIKPTICVWLSWNRYHSNLLLHMHVDLKGSSGLETFIDWCNRTISDPSYLELLGDEECWSKDNLMEADAMFFKNNQYVHSEDICSLENVIR